MKIYNNVKRVSDLRLADRLSDNMEVLLAYLRKNYKTSLSNIQQKKIISLSQYSSEESGKDVPITVTFSNGTNFHILVKNGTQGIQGRVGKVGPTGDKGDDPSKLNDPNIVDWLTIANDTKTEDPNKLFSALQGVSIAEAIELLSETFLSEYQYSLLFTDHVTIDAEFETFEVNQSVQLIAEDNASHKRYTKYWTFESEGEEEYFIFNYHTQNYDSVYADIWKDIYMGGKSGFFEATTNQIGDGTQLYIINETEYPDIKYDKIEQFNDTIYIKGLLEDGSEGYIPSSLNEGEGPWFIKEYLKVDGEYKENYRQVNQEYIDKNIEKTYGQKDFTYYLRTANCYIDVNYTQANGYDYNLHAIHLDENIYIFDHIDANGRTIYNKISFAEVNPDSPTVYYMRTSDGYVAISDVKNYIKKKEYRYYKYVEGNWKEIESMDSINVDNYEEYIVVHYQESNNTNTFTHYIPVKTIRDEYYDVKSGILNDYSIVYYVNYTDNEPRRYFTRRIITSTDNNGNQVFDYIYKEITIPFWLEAEFVTEIEDQTVRILSNNPEVNEIGDVEIIDPIYISSIEFENNYIEIAKNFNKNVDVNIFPENANVTDMIIEYDDSLINFYEDGRIAALTNDEITKETSIKVYTEHDNSVSDTLNIKIITPIESIELEPSKIDLYPGTSIQIKPTIYPEIVSNNKLHYEFSDPEMLTIDSNLVVSPKKQNDGTYKMGECSLIITADDGFGAKLEVPVLVAIPITKIDITSRNFGFIGRKFMVETAVEPYNATLIKLNFESSNEDVATVDNNGYVTPLSLGEFILTCSSTDGSGVSTSQRISITQGIDSINIKDLENSIEVGLTDKFEIEILPQNATNKDLNIIFSDQSVIDYTQPTLKEGTTNVYEMSITGKKGGSTQFVLMAKDGTETFAEKELTIPIPIDKISFEEPEIILYEGDDIKLIRTIVTGPESVNNSSLEWWTSNNAVATVDTNGRVKPIKSGKAYISAISKDENKVIGSCLVIVKKHTSKIILNNGNENIKILLNNFGFINAEVEPWDASDQLLQWSSSNELVCIVEENGTIYGKGIGESIITVTAIDNPEIAVSINVEVVKEIKND